MPGLAAPGAPGRSFENYLHANGVTNARNLSALTRLVWTYENGLFRHDPQACRDPQVQPTHTQLWELFKRRQEDIALGSLAASDVQRVPVRAFGAVLGGGWVILSDAGCAHCGAVAPDLDEFYGQLAMQRPGSIDGVRLFVKLMNDKSRDRDSSLTYTQRIQLALLIKAWNAYREGLSLSTLTYSAYEPFPVPH